MKVGIVLPQGWLGEYEQWDPTTAWARTRALAQLAEELGFESVWVVDHLHTIQGQSMMFESFTALAALAEATTNVRLGHLVICAAFRNPALTAKMVSTIDVLSGGRMEIGIGAGWKKDEWEAYGYRYSKPQQRLRILQDHLEVITRLTRAPHATYRGQHASILNAINLPQPIQDSGIPILVGGNGPYVTWRLAARYANELNLDGLAPDAVRDALPVIASRCEEASRDPASLAVSVHIWSQQVSQHGSDRTNMIAAYQELGISRVMTNVGGAATSDRALESFAADCKSAGLDFH